jgi:hypothetical protein
VPATAIITAEVIDDIPVQLPTEITAPEGDDDEDD